MRLPPVSPSMRDDKRRESNRPACQVVRPSPVPAPTVGTPPSGRPSLTRATVGCWMQRPGSHFGSVDSEECNADETQQRWNIAILKE